MQLTDSISNLSGVGAQRSKLYNRLGVTLIQDILTLYPRDYLDLTSPVLINEAILEEQNLIKATVYKKTGEQRIRAGLSLFKVLVTDGINNMTVTIFNAKFQYQELVEGEEYFLLGKVTGTLLRREMSSPNFVKVMGDDLLRPIYPQTEGLSNKMIQTNMREALKLWGDCLEDSIPTEVKQRQVLCQYRYAVENIHFPKDRESLDLARRRLIFEELYTLQLKLIELRKKNRTPTDVKLANCDLSDFYNTLPFTLTAGQLHAIDDAIADMQKGVAMNRLCEGDVGSGKTMVAAALMYCCYKNGYQSVMMAPTQILADQHYTTLSRLLEPLSIRVGLLTGAVKATARREILEGIAKGEYSLIVGTHALVEETVTFKNLGLVVTDEQHRFGVEQRAKLSRKGDNPHLLVMSATPIPRTLALTIYGDLDVSIIAELPKGRKSIETYSVTSNKRARALLFVKKQLDEGRQAFIVCPLIEENESDLVSVAQYIEALKSTPLSGYKIGGINGKLTAAQKEEIMAQFKRNTLQILVATTVVEVGIDIPNANIMLIENAERFGLSQLHQLRGRVGRGDWQSYCVLISDNQGEDNKKRLQVMSTTNDGFVIAEQDLLLRGPGDFFGNKQSGLPPLKLANLITDMDIVEQARKEAINSEC